MINPRTETGLLANTERYIPTGPLTFFRLTSIPTDAVITVATIQHGNKSDFTPMRSVTDTMELASPSEGIYVKSTVAGSVSFEYALDDRKKVGAANLPTVASGGSPVSTREDMADVMTGDANTTIAAGATGTVKNAAAAQSSGGYITLENTAPGPIRLDGTGVPTAAAGLWLYPGQTLFVPMLGNITGFNPNAVDVRISSVQLLYT